MARNNYNRYAQPYLPPQSGGNLVYQPSFDANSTVNQMLVDDFDMSQQRYDAGRQKFADFKGVVGGMDSYSPDLLQNRLGEFSENVSGTVQDQYGGDWGLAANDIVEMIADERAHPLYKAIDYQNKEADLFRKAEMQKLNQGERFVGKTDPGSVDLGQYIGDDGQIDSRYMQEMKADYLIAPDYDQAATDLIKDIPANANQYYKSLGQKDADLFAQAVGEGNIAGFLEKRGYKGNSAKLGKLEDQLTKSLYNKHKEAFDAESSESGKTGEEYAREVIQNKIPQLSYHQTTSGIQNFAPKDDSESLSFGTPTITRTTSNVVDGANTKEFKDVYGSGKVNIDAPYVSNENSEKLSRDYNNQKEILESSFSSSQQKAAAARKMDQLKNKGALDAENHAKGLKRVADFEANNGMQFLGSNGVELSPSRKLEAISNIEDAKNTYSENYLTFNNFYRDEGLVLQDASEMLADGNFNAKSVTDEKGSGIEVDGSTLKYSGPLNNKKLEDFSVKGVNPDNLKIIAEKGDRQIEYYPNDQAQEVGQKIKEHNSNLKTQGYSVLSNYGGEPYLVVEKFNRRSTNKTLPYGSYENVAVQIPQELAGSITSKEQAEAYYKALVSQGAQRVSNNSLMVDVANKAGNLFKFSSKVQ